MDELASFLDGNLEDGCWDLTYVFRPGEEQDPRDRGLTAESVGMSEEAFEMGSRRIEWAHCWFASDSVLGLARFDGTGLALDTYEQYLTEVIVPEACAAFPDAAAVIEVIWADGATLWNVGPGSRDSGEIRARPIDEQRAIAEEVAGLVGGRVIEVDCGRSSSN